MDNVSVIETGGKVIYLLGTAHVSGESAREAKELIENVMPDSVCIELDADRLNNILDPKGWNDTDVSRIIKEKKAAFLLANLILSSYQKRLGDKLGSSPGKEMLVSALTAKENGINIVTADRNIRTTFLRIWRKMGFFAKIKLLFGLIFGFIEDEEITSEDIEHLKEQDMLEAALSEISGELPELKTVLVDERNMYLACNIKNACGEKIVAVVGAAHTPGIKKLLESNEELSTEKLDVIPPAKPIGKIIGWAIPAVIVLMMLFTLTKDPFALLLQLKQWVLYNGTLSALGTLLAGGHILSIITAFVAAPITSLNPLLAAGWFAGLTEAKVNKPTVEDFNKLSDDLKTLKGLWKNKLTKILLVVVLANIGSSIGTFAGGIGIFNIFKRLI